MHRRRWPRPWPAAWRARAPAKRGLGRCGPVQRVSPWTDVNMVGAKLTAPGAPICAGPCRLAHSRHKAGAGADRRCQSTPAISHCHCSSLSSHTASPACGQTKWPLCKRRWHSHRPLPSQHTSLSRLLNT